MTESDRAKQSSMLQFFRSMPNVVSQTVNERLDHLEKAVDNLKETPKPKDNWDKINAASGLVSGGLVAIISILATYIYNERQRKNLEQQKQRELAILQVQTVQGFIPQLQSDDPQAVEAALLAITALGNSKLATDLATLFKSQGAIAALEKIAINPDQGSAGFAQKSLSNLFAPLKGLVAEIHGKEHLWGAGFLIGSDGRVVTTDFVVDSLDDPGSIRVKIADKFYDAELIAKKPENHLALIRVKNSENFSYLKLVENPDASKDTNIFILKPEPFGANQWLGATGKIIKEVSRSHDMEVIETTVQTGVGTAGSPAVNQYGQVVGMSFASKPKAFGKTNLLIPATYIIQFVEEVSKSKEN
ncbi:MAG: serine protease [Cyanobacteria bacterium P01_E01_bin.6]